MNWWDWDWWLQNVAFVQTRFTFQIGTTWIFTTRQPSSSERSTQLAVWSHLGGTVTSLVKRGICVQWKNGQWQDSRLLTVCPCLCIDRPCQGGNYIFQTSEKHNLCLQVNCPEEQLVILIGFTLKSRLKRKLTQNGWLSYWSFRTTLVLYNGGEVKLMDTKEEGRLRSFAHLGGHG